MTVFSPVPWHHGYIYRAVQNNIRTRRDIMNWHDVPNNLARIMSCLSCLWVCAYLLTPLPLKLKSDKHSCSQMWHFYWRFLKSNERNRTIRVYLVGLAAVSGKGTCSCGGVLYEYNVSEASILSQVISLGISSSHPTAARGLCCLFGDQTLLIKSGV